MAGFMKNFVSKLNLVIFVWLFVSCASSPPPPQITYGEFPFRFEYEINGERYIIEDTVIAEFDRSISGSATTRARRIWATSLERGNERRIVLKHDDTISISFSPGLAQYFMGDLHGGDRLVQNPSIWAQPRIVIRAVNEEGRINLVAIRPDEAHEILAEHGILLISWERSEPIVNRFGNN